MKLIIEDERGRRTPVSLSVDELRVGRAAGNEIRLKERNVSRNHARILVRDGKAYIEDTSRYGSHINGRRFTGTVELTAEDVVAIGSYKLSIEGLAERTGPAGPPRFVPPAVVTFGPPRLLARSPGLEGRCWLLADGVTIGSDPSCDVVIDRPNVAAHHVRLQIVGGQWIARQDPGGTFFQINGRLTDETELSRGDTLRIGDAVLQFIEEQEIHVGYVPRNMDDMEGRFAGSQKIRRLAVL